MTRQTIVSDAGPLIALAKTGQLYILERLFEKVLVPPSVLDELKISTSRSGAAEIKRAIEKGWIEVSHPLKIPKVLMNALDPGEAEAIILARNRGLVLLVDEKRGRRVAPKEQVKITGTGAVLVAAKQKGIIKQVLPLIDDLRACGYRIADPLRLKILKLAHEDR
jgi:predicted nucleic acid-binding protein